MTTNEQARADHKCGACGGLGRIDKPHRIGGSSFYDGYATLVFCPVCLGSGRISDRMPAADAMADAETLLNLSYTEPKDWAAEAWNTGGFIRWYLDRENGICEPEYLAVVAESAARAAFRAVPGLRGE